MARAAGGVAALDAHVEHAAAHARGAAACRRASLFAAPRGLRDADAGPDADADADATQRGGRRCRGRQDQSSTPLQKAGKWGRQVNR